MNAAALPYGVHWTEQPTRGDRGPADATAERGVVLAVLGDPVLLLVVWPDGAMTGEFAHSLWACRGLDCAVPGCDQAIAAAERRAGVQA